MRLWRLTRSGQTALDGEGTRNHGGRYSPLGAPVVNFASEAGLAVLVALRYLRGDPGDAPDDYLLGWTEIDAIPERVDSAGGAEASRERVSGWPRGRRGRGRRGGGRRASERVARGASQLVGGGPLAGSAGSGRRIDEPAPSRCDTRTAARHPPVQLLGMSPRPADARALPLS